MAPKQQGLEDEILVARTQSTGLPRQSRLRDEFRNLRIDMVIGGRMSNTLQVLEVPSTQPTGTGTPIERFEDDKGSAVSVPTSIPESTQVVNNNAENIFCRMAPRRKDRE